MMEVPVLIAGAGPAGLVTAIEVARRGVECLLINRRTAPSPFPRANVVSTRAMELVRSWGLEARVREDAADVEWLGWMGDTLAAPTGSGVPVGFPTRDQSALISPTGPACVSQAHLEVVLLEHLRSLPAARVELGAALTAVEPGRDAVTITLDGERSVRAQHLVGADGIRSTVRAALGIPLRGPGTVAERLGVQFRAPLWDRLGERRHPIYMVGGDASFAPAGSSGRWVWANSWDPSRERLGDYTEARVSALIRDGAGMPDLEVEIDGIGAISYGAALAERFREGRVFLTGDAAHRMTPRGAMGMNTAILSGHDLGWKLAWVHRGWAGEELLDTYEAERRPVAEHNIARSVDPNGSLRPAGEGLHVDLGGRIPHLWLADGRSTLDLVGPGLTRFSGPVADAARNGAGPPVAVRSLGAMAARALGIRPDGALVVRPDAVVV